MTNSRASHLRGVDTDPNHPEQLPAPVRHPHLATGFFLIAITMVAAVMIAGALDSQIRVAGVAVVAVAISMVAFWLVVAQPTIETLASASAEGGVRTLQSNELQRDLESISAEKDQQQRKIARLGGILSATQHELNREITMLGFAVDDLVDEADAGPVSDEVVDQLKIALDHVEEGQRNVSALSRLGTSDRTDRIGSFRASDVAPLTTESDVVIERNDEIYGDVDLWRLFVKNAARNAEAHGKARIISLSSGDGRLSISDDGEGCTTAALEQAWKAGLRPNGTRSDGTQIMRRVAEAHGALVTMQGEPGEGVRFVVDLRDLEIDLRDRGAVDRPVGTPHKANGGRVSIGSQGTLG